MEEDEELLLLRIKALKSSSRVNIQVDIHSDSDSEQKKKFTQVKQAEVTIERHDQNKTVIIDASDVNKTVQLSDATNDEVELRQMALSTVNKRTRKVSLSKDIDTAGQDAAAVSPPPISIQSVAGISGSSCSSAPKNHTDVGKNIEELSLREKALKSLLRTRVAKTEELIKVTPLFFMTSLNKCAP